MPRLSAGLLMYRIQDETLQVLLAHPGGPYFVNKDDGAWSIPKGEPDADEDLLLTAQREFEEETSITPTGPFIPLKSIQQKGGKIVHAWAFEGDCDPAAIKSNTFTMEQPCLEKRVGDQGAFTPGERVDDPGCWPNQAATRNHLTTICRFVTIRLSNPFLTRSQNHGREARTEQIPSDP